MLTKMKIALVLCGSLLCGVAAAQPAGAGKADRKAQHEAKKAEMLKTFDTNKNGKLDDNEKTAMFEAKTLERFKKLDTDGNGVLSLAEFKAGKQNHMGKGKRHARGGKGMGRGHRGGFRGQGRQGVK
jgi:hypothetical protein